MTHITVTRIQRLQIDKHTMHALQQQARLCGKWRSRVWQQFGSLNSISKSPAAVVKQLRQEGYKPLNSQIWAECIRDTVGNIKAYREAAKELVKRAIWQRVSGNDAVSDEERHRLFKLLKSNRWVEDPFLHRQMRKRWRHGHNSTYNQIVLTSNCYKLDGLSLRISPITGGEFLFLQLHTPILQGSNIRVILRDNTVELHYAVKVPVEDRHGVGAVGIDKGFTEVFVDSNNRNYGVGFGEVLNAESDYLTTKYRRRNKLRALVEKHRAAGRHAKARRIIANNMGKQKLNHHRFLFQQKTKTMVYTATHRLVDNADTIVCEDLTFVSHKSLGKRMNRRLSAWLKGLIAKSLHEVSHRRQATVHVVNAAYTSQIDSSTGCFTGVRRGDRFYCANGDCIQADYNGARNVLARKYDREISRWMKPAKVKSILRARTERRSVETAQPVVQLQHTSAINGQ